MAAKGRDECVQLEVANADDAPHVLGLHNTSVELEPIYIVETHYHHHENGRAGLPLQLLVQRYVGFAGVSAPRCCGCSTTAARAPSCRPTAAVVHLPFDAAERSSCATRRTGPR